MPLNATKLDYQGIIQDAQPSPYNCQGQKGQGVQNVRSLPLRGAAIAGYRRGAGTSHRKGARREQETHTVQHQTDR